MNIAVLNEDLGYENKAVELYMQADGKNHFFPNSKYLLLLLNFVKISYSETL